MAYDLGTIGAAVTLDSSDYMRKIQGVQGQTMSVIKKIAGMAAAYLSARTIFRFAWESVKYFSDMQETANKFSVVFDSVSLKAKRAADELHNYYGQSEEGAKNLLAGTGDVLAGFEFDPEMALELSQRVAKLGIDLASFTNFAGGSKGAVNALTKAMLGETESAKALGIVIRQDSEEFKSMVADLMKSKGMTLIQAKAFAAIAIAIKQAKNAIGDYKRTHKSLANQLREFSDKTMPDMQAAIGGFIAELFGVEKGVLDINKALQKVSEVVKYRTVEWIYAIKTVWIEIEAGAKMMWALIEPIASQIGENWKNQLQDIATGFSNTMTVGVWFFENIGKMAANLPTIFGAVAKDILYNFTIVPRGIYEAFNELAKNIFDLLSKVGKNIWKVLTGKMSVKEAINDSLQRAGDAFNKTLDGITDKGAGLIGNIGKNTERALQQIGATKMPELEMPKFNWIADPGKAIEKYKQVGNTLDEIERERIRKQSEAEANLRQKMIEQENQLRKDLEKRQGDKLRQNAKKGSAEKAASAGFESFGSFSSAALAVIGGSASTQQQIATATSNSAKSLRKIEKKEVTYGP